jgi:hypothetical protein
MVVFAKEMQSAGVGSAHAAQSEGSVIPLRDGERWLVAQTLRHRGQLARLDPGSQGFRSFLPTLSQDGWPCAQFARGDRAGLCGTYFRRPHPERDRWRSINGFLA